MATAVAKGVFPGCVLVVGRPSAGGSRLLTAGLRGMSRNREAVKADLVYDLASITKIVATTPLTMISQECGKLSLGSNLASLLTRTFEDFSLPKESPYQSLSLQDLLTHQSGLPPWRPYYLNPALRQPEKLLEAILSEPPLAAPGERTVYSDLNFILLGLLLEKIWSEDLGALFHNLVAAPLGLTKTLFRPDPFRLTLAPTEDGPRLGGPLDYPGVKVMGPVPLGRVHDDNAAFLGGAAGHAGLFGAAGDLWRLVQELARIYDGSCGAPLEKQAETDLFRAESANSAATMTATVGRAEQLGRTEQVGRAGQVDRAEQAGPSPSEPMTRPGWSETIRPLLASQETLKQFLIPRAPKNGGLPRAAGFDVGLGPLAGAVGHLGYTGGCLWWDPVRDRAFVFLTNRVNPTARASKMEAFRRELAERIWTGS
ncbi:MAG: serine hydrolase [Deltaproteobacteria bacterium]|nr:serine hydrolase [Deltaproteobacteria bacterium]